MDSENEQSSHQVKTLRFVLDNKHKCQIKRNHSSTHVSLPASAILFPKLCCLFQISSGRNGRASKSGRRPIERTGIVLPTPAALPLAQTNLLYKSVCVNSWCLGHFPFLGHRLNKLDREPVYDATYKISMLYGLAQEDIQSFHKKNIRKH